MSFHKDECLYTTNKLQNTIANICKLQYKYFLNKANVIGVGCGYKVKNAFRTNQLCIQVFVSRKCSKEHLSASDLIPSNFKGIPIDVLNSGAITLNSLTQRVRPVKGGYSISASPTEDYEGTAGCLVTNGVLKFLLSTNHLLAKFNTLTIGTPIVQPAYQFGGTIPSDTIATLYRYVPLRFIEGQCEPVNLSDCAIGLLTDKNIFSPEIALIGKVKCVKNPVLHVRVKKVGATTELTQGTITSVNVTFIGDDPEGNSFLFEDQVFTTKMSDTGDSGAIVVNNNNCAVGLLLGSSNDVSVFSRINTVLDQLDVHLVT